MAEEQKFEDLDALRASVTRQGAAVRQLKKDGAAQELVTEAVNALKALKVQLEAALQADQEGKAPEFDRAALEDLCRRRMFFVPSFEIYGGVAGFFDFGPPGCALKANFLDMWRRHFVWHENMLEVETTTMMPDIVLRTSGHVEKFADLMVKDEATGECYRADKLLEDHIEKMLEDASHSSERREELGRISRQADAYSKEELGGILTELGVTAPATGNALTAPFPFNLMFASNIGPEGHNPGYLRPETAQGMFINFRRLLDYNAGKMPFAAAQIGLALRNEISPRAGLLRVREFTMAEIEHFVDPEDKSHPEFDSIADMKLRLFPGARQVGDGKMVTDVTLGDAVATGLIANQTLAYFMARTQLFLLAVGVQPQWLRFRQHLPTEMAHYASDCWDAEIYMSYGWIECVGIADRACYDLKVHSAKSKVALSAAKRYAQPKMVDAVKIKANKGLMGRSFKKQMKVVYAAVEALSVEDALALEASLAEAGEAQLGPLEDGSSYTLTRDMLSLSRTTKKVSEVKYFPSVIEPSFGVGRVLYAVLEHSYSVREGDEQRGVLSFPAAIAPIKVAVLPLSGHPDFLPSIRAVSTSLARAGITNKVDASSAAVGRRYARMDELGVPFAVTVDFETAASRTVTLRERDSTAQIRLPIADVPTVVAAMVSGESTFADAMLNYPVVSAGTAAAGSTGARVVGPLGSQPAPAAATVESHVSGACPIQFTRPASATAGPSAAAQQ